MRNYVATDNIPRVLRNFLLFTYVNYMVVESKYITHHIERLKGTCNDRGSVKWIAESNKRYWEDVDAIPDSRLSHIDESDCFPRFYFKTENFIDELEQFNTIRKQELLK